MSRLPWHPVLVAAFPVLFLWSQNTGEVTPDDTLPVLGLVVAGTVAIWLLGAAVLRNLGRGALVASTLAILALSYGRVWGSTAPALGVTVWVLLAVAVAWGVARLQGETLGNVTAIANVTALALVLVPGIPVVTAELQRGAGLQLPDDPDVVGEGPGRDIYYIILDRYPREDSAREVFGYDNSSFTAYLEGQDFDVAQESLANYPKTAHSLAASLNMTYLDELSEADAEGDDWQPVYAMLRDHRVGRLMTDFGYEYIHLGTWWSPTATAATADVTLRYDASSEFAQVFESTTILPAAEALLGIDDDEAEPGWRRNVRNHTAWQLDELDRLAGDPHRQPRFVFAHLTIPHEPYVFAADGSFVPGELEASRDRTANFIPQLEYANLRIRGFLDALLDGPDERDPIVILQSDEGPHPEERVRQGPGYRWDEAPLEELQEKLRILNAYYLPGVAGEDPVREDITPVNSFRLVFDTYFGTDLGQLPDKVYIFPDEARLYDFEEITERVR